MDTLNKINDLIEAIQVLVNDPDTLGEISHIISRGILDIIYDVEMAKNQSDVNIIRADTASPGIEFLEGYEDYV